MHIGTEAPTLSALMRDRTHSLHGQAERSGFVSDMLRGKATRRGYALFLRNLLPAYEQLEAGLERQRDQPVVRELARGEVYRAKAITADLDSLCGPGWRDEVPILPAGRRYADSIAASADGAGEGLVGHAYVRYLGDLNGGQVLSRLLAKSLDLPPETLSFYEFSQIQDLAPFRLFYREAMDRSAEWILDWDGVADTATQAFLMNIEVSEAVRDAVSESAGERA